MMDQAGKLRKLMEKNKGVKEKNKDEKVIEIYTIASGKGGVGKTNLVVNMAISLQKKGRNVLVIDADLGLANVDVILGMYPKYTLYDVLFHNKSLKETIIYGPEGIKVIPGGSGILEMANLDVQKQETILKEFLNLGDVDTILIDTGAGLSKNLLSFITFSQELIVVTTPEPTALTDAYSVIKVLSQYNFKKHIKVVINRVPSRFAAQSTFEKLEVTSKKFLQVDLENLGYILDDIRVVRSVMNQVPFIIQHPHCLASKCIDSITDKFIHEKKQGHQIKTIQEVLNRLIKVFG